MYRIHGFHASAPSVPQVGRKTWIPLGIWEPWVTDKSSALVPYQSARRSAHFGQWEEWGGREKGGGKERKWHVQRRMSFQYKGTRSHDTPEVLKADNGDFVVSAVVLSGLSESRRRWGYIWLCSLYVGLRNRQLNGIDRGNSFLFIREWRYSDNARCYINTRKMTTQCPAVPGFHHLHSELVLTRHQSWSQVLYASHIHTSRTPDRQVRRPCDTVLNNQLNFCYGPVCSDSYLVSPSYLNTCNMPSY